MTLVLIDLARGSLRRSLRGCFFASAAARASSQAIAKKTGPETEKCLSQCSCLQTCGCARSEPQTADCGLSTRVVSATPQACRDYGHGLLVGADPAYTGEAEHNSLLCRALGGRAGRENKSRGPRQARAALGNAATRRGAQNGRGLTEIAF